MTSRDEAALKVLRRVLLDGDLAVHLKPNDHGMVWLTVTDGAWITPLEAEQLREWLVTL